MSTVRTVSGIDFDPLNPKGGVVRISDIAHALSAINRFTGHTKWPYNVAQHSVYVSQLVKDMGGDKTDQLRALLHDSTEAYMGDIPSPMKRLPQMEWYRDAEHILEGYLACAFGVGCFMTPIVVKADLIALAMEARDLMGNPQWPVIAEVEKPEWRIIPLMSMPSRNLFLDRYHELAYHAIATEA